MSGKRGDYYEQMPVDQLILRVLPEVGTIGGVHWRGRQVRDIVDELAEDGIDVDGDLVAARLRSMHVVGHVRRFPATRKVSVWAKTESGVALQDKEEE